MGGIIICEYCGKYECPPACPAFEGRISGTEIAGRCTLCGSYVYGDDGHIAYANKTLCAECAEELVPEELLELLQCADIKDFFKMLR